MRRTVCMVLTILLHCAVLLPWGVSIPKKSDRPPIKVEIVDFAPLDFVPLSDDSLVHVHCPMTYEGIGVEFDWTGRIFRVAKGWPAHKHGIQVGDVVHGYRELFPVDGYMTFDVDRNGKILHFNIKTEKVCASKPSIRGS